MGVSVTFVGTGDSFGSGGRFNTCFLVDADGYRFCIDFGATSLVALNRLGIPHNSIDAILLSHLHGDHCGGVPPMLVDAMLGSRRQSPLTIAGPGGMTARMREVNSALMPGMEVMTPKFDLTWRDLPTLVPNEIGPLRITTYPAIHTRETNPTSLRIEVAGKVVSYTGDSEWTEHMPALARGADLLIAECYFYRKPVRFHLNHPDIVAHRSELGARRLILTHMGPEMLASRHLVNETCADDGMVVQI